MAEWMADVFIELVNRSIAASWLVLAVLVLRLLLRRGPRWASVLLWGLVGFRLVCPFTLESASATSFTVDIPLMLGVMAVLVIPALWRQKLYRWQGALLLVSYAAYCVFLYTAA